MEMLIFLVGTLAFGFSANGYIMMTNEEFPFYGADSSVESEQSVLFSFPKLRLSPAQALVMVSELQLAVKNREAVAKLNAAVKSALESGQPDEVLFAQMSSAAKLFLYWQSAAAPIELDRQLWHMRFVFGERDLCEMVHFGWSTLHRIWVHPEAEGYFERWQNRQTARGSGAFGNLKDNVSRKMGAFTAQLGQTHERCKAFGKMPSVRVQLISDALKIEWKDA